MAFFDFNADDLHIFFFFFQTDVHVTSTYTQKANIA